jgi:glycosyltransferase involved in cell wall biosynthesis
MRIAFVGRYAEGEILSGPEKFSRRVFEEISRVPDVATVFVDYFFDGRIHGRCRKIFGAEPMSRDGNGEVMRLGSARIPGFLSRFQPEALAVTAFERFAAVAVLWARFHRIPVLYAAHGVVKHENENYRRGVAASPRRRDAAVERLLFAAASKICFLSDDSVALARRYYAVPDERVLIMDNGVDALFSEVVPGHGGKLHPFTLAFAGDPARPEKGWQFLLDALAQAETPLRLLAFGVDESMRGHVPAGVELLPHPLLPAGEMARLFGTADCFVCPSIFETFSIVTAEAMAAGLPAVVTRTSGIARHIRDGYNGYTVDYGDSRKLASIIDTIRSDTDLLRRMSANARLIGTELSWSVVAGRYLEAFKELSGRKRNAGKRSLKK